MNDLIVGVVSGIITTYLVKWLQYVFKGDGSTEEHLNTSEEYINKIKREFYFCFPIALVLVIVSRYTPSDSFLSVGIITTATILFTLSLFAFMCAMDVVNELTNSNSDQETNKKVS
ncbi:hypothetical protein [Desulfosporosinus sp. OT]|uniref:hypothetical protein n=1 Tax=Desulfosporosinus sp. OT TaxID=913865 RepID=UPI0002239F87|nr:hypothetical protein [Desulfosporosinus sp. OT]EGW40686.1 putative membrane protein [Desulfosporosinus sp. OT]